MSRPSESAASAPGPTAGVTDTGPIRVAGRACPRGRVAIRSGACGSTARRQDDEAPEGLDHPGAVPSGQVVQQQTPDQGEGQSRIRPCITGIRTVRHECRGRRAPAGTPSPGPGSPRSRDGGRGPGRRARRRVAPRIRGPEHSPMPRSPSGCRGRRRLRTPPRADAARTHRPPTDGHVLPGDAQSVGRGRGPAGGDRRWRRVVLRPATGGGPKGWRPPSAASHTPPRGGVPAGAGRSYASPDVSNSCTRARIRASRSPIGRSRV